jgi:hypothetical protein
MNLITKLLFHHHYLYGPSSGFAGMSVPIKVAIPPPLSVRDKVKWLIFGLYRPPSMPNNLFTKHMRTLFYKGIKYYENLIVIGNKAM